jgi:protein involved in polysaccharide export with SLBB domain
LSPRFQLEITNFASQRAIVNIKSGSSGSIDPDATEANSSVIILNDRASTLRDILAAGGRGVSSTTDTLVTLQRDGATYRMRLRDVFSPKSQDVQIMDGDVIFVEDLSSAITSGTAQVSADGSVLLPDIGRIPAAGLSIEELNRFASQKIRSTVDIKKNNRSCCNWF